MNKKYLKLIIIELFLVTLFVIIFFIVKSNYIYNISPSCFFKENFDIYCPSCGGTRCIINLINGNILDAFLYNPFIFIIIIYLFCLNIIYIINTVFDKNILKCLHPKPYFIILFVLIWIVFTIYKNVQ